MKSSRKNSHRLDFFSRWIRRTFRLVTGFFRINKHSSIQFTSRYKIKPHGLAFYSPFSYTQIVKHMKKGRKNVFLFGYSINLKLFFYFTMRKLINERQQQKQRITQNNKSTVEYFSLVLRITKKENNNHPWLVCF